MARLLGVAVAVEIPASASSRIEIREAPAPLARAVLARQIRQG